MIQPSELPINADGSVFHLHLRPEQLADKIILVGDQDRVTMVASYFDKIECEVQSREFHTITGTYQGKRISCVSTGIGCDNIDIVMTELDALATIDLNTREVKPQSEQRQLELVRIGTCGGLQPFTPIGTYVVSVKSIGFDGLLNYYAGRDNVCDLDTEKAFVEHMNWSAQKPAPYVVVADKELIARITKCNENEKANAYEDETLRYDTAKAYEDENPFVLGMTCACGGFYGPQGRAVRLIPQDPQQNEKIESFEYDGLKVCNFEMESSALAGLASLLGHKAMTCCLVIANRYNKEMNTAYKSSITDLIKIVIERI